MDPQLIAGLVFDFFPIPNVAFTLEHFRQAALHFGDGQNNVLPLHADRVTDLCEHIGDRVGHHGAYDSFTNWPSLRQE
jgi:hypothetical protein